MLQGYRQRRRPPVPLPRDPRMASDSRGTRAQGLDAAAACPSRTGSAVHHLPPRAPAGGAAGRSDLGADRLRSRCAPLTADESGIDPHANRAQVIWASGCGRAQRSRSDQGPQPTRYRAATGAPRRPGTQAPRRVFGAGSARPGCSARCDGRPRTASGRAPPAALRRRAGCLTAPPTAVPATTSAVGQDQAGRHPAHSPGALGRAGRLGQESPEEPARATPGARSGCASAQPRSVPQCVPRPATCRTSIALGKRVNAATTTNGPAGTCAPSGPRPDYHAADPVPAGRAEQIGA